MNGVKSEYKKFSSFDVLRLEEVMQHEEFNHQTFKDHIKYCKKGYFETVLPWILYYSPLPSKRQLNKARLFATTKRLEKMGELEQYHQIMKDQINTGVLKPIPDQHVEIRCIISLIMQF